MRILGIDPSKDALVVYADGEVFKVPNSVEGFQRIAALRPDQVVIEGARTFTQRLVRYLQDHGVEVRDVSPFRLARFREMMRQDKDDAIDAEAVFSFAVHFPSLTQKVSGRVHLSEAMGFLDFLSKERVRIKNRLQAKLRELWPGFTFQLKYDWEWEFLRQCPTPEEVDQQVLRGLRPRIRVRLQEYLQKERVRPMAYEIMRFQVQELVGMFLHLQKVEERVMAWVRRELQATPEGRALLGIPGVGEILAGWILSVWEPGRFPTLGQWWAYCGLAPKRYESAGTERKMRRVRVHRRLQTGFLLASLSRFATEEGKAFRKRRKGKRGTRWAMARYLARRVYRALQNFEVSRGVKGAERVKGLLPCGSPVKSGKMGGIQ